MSQASAGGCSRSDGFWQSSRKNCQRGFLKARTARLPGNQAYGLLMGSNPEWQDRTTSQMQPLWTSVHRMHEESSAPSGARFESAPHRLERRRGRCRTSTSKRGLGWLAPSRFNIAAHANLARQSYKWLYSLFLRYTTLNIRLHK